MFREDYSNKTLYGLENQGSRYIWIVFYLFVFVSSGIGDSVILVATNRFQTFRLHRSIVVIVQHIAVCDLLVAVIAALPRLVSLLADRWVFGHLLCQVMPYLAQSLSVASMLLICAMVFCKVAILAYPIRARSLIPSRAHKVCAAIWIASIIPSINYIILNRGREIPFDYRIYTCYLTSISGRWLHLSFVSIFLFVPPILVIVVTVPLVKHLVVSREFARKAGGAQRWQGILTTVMVAAGYCISILPYAVYRFGESFVEGETGRRYFHGIYYRVASSLLFINTVSNFYIYSCTVPSFRRFLCLHVRRFFMWLGCAIAIGKGNIFESYAVLSVSWRYLN